MGKGMIWVCLAVVVLAAGCLPEISVQWSDNGAVGVGRLDDNLVLIDGATGKYSVVEEKVGFWPGISGDGKQVVYARPVKFESLDDGLAVLAAQEQAAIKALAEKLGKKIMAAGGLEEGKWPTVAKGPLAPKGEPGAWVVRYLCERGEASVREKVGAAKVEGAAKEALTGHELVVAEVVGVGLGERRVVLASVVEMARPVVSPAGGVVAYLTDQGEGHFDLRVAALEEELEGVLVQKDACLGYAWRPDGRALTFLGRLSGESEEGIAGELVSVEVVEGNGQLQVKAKEELAFVVYGPENKVAYGEGGRVFFSSTAVTLPTGRAVDARNSVFCYDPLTGTVSDVLPRSVSEAGSPGVGYFELSPDGKRVVMAGKKSAFVVYAFGETEGKETGKASEKDKLVFAPVWKGNEAVTCMLAGEDELLAGREVEDQELVLAVVRPGGGVEMVIEGRDEPAKEAVGEGAK